MSAASARASAVISAAVPAMSASSRRCGASSPRGAGAALAPPSLIPARIGPGRRADRIRTGGDRRPRQRPWRRASPAGREDRRGLHADRQFRTELHRRIPPAEAFAAFGRIREIADCIPGAFVDGEPAPNRVEGGIRVRFGPISPVFRGAALIERDEEKLAGRILGAGADAASGRPCKGKFAIAS